jgi:hypothetical protein
VICNKKRGKKNNKLHRISDKSINDAYIKTSILIPFGCRVCKIHLDEYGFLKKFCLGKRMVFSFFILLFYSIQTDFINCRIIRAKKKQRKITV